MGETMVDKIIQKTLQEYSYLNIDESVYLNYAKDVKYESMEEYESCLIKYLDRELRNNLKNNEKETINHFINFICDKDYNTFHKLRKISNFFSKNKINCEIDCISYLVTNNISLNKLLKEYIHENINNLKNENFDDNLITMIEIYCDFNEIEIHEEVESISNVKNPLSEYYREIKKYPVLTSKEEKEIFKKIKDGDKEAYDYFVKCNLRLVVKYAYKFPYYEGDIWDLISEGNLGIMRAIEGFNPDMGYKFSTYATWWIKLYMKRYISKNS